MSANKKQGGCLCKAVSFEVDVPEDKIHACHCGLCAKWSGGPALAVGCSDFEITAGEDKVKWFKSSEWAERGFCSECGTSLLFRTLDGSYKGVMAGTLEDGSDLEMGGHIFIDKKPAYYDFNDDCPRMTEKEFLEQYG